MITIQRGVIVTLPDDAPVPPGAVVIADPPTDFQTNRSAYRVEGDRLVRLTDEEIAKRRRRRSGPRLTKDDIRRLKEALDAGRI